MSGGLKQRVVLVYTSQSLGSMPFRFDSVLIIWNVRALTQSDSELSGVEFLGPQGISQKLVEILGLRTPGARAGRAARARWGGRGPSDSAGPPPRAAPAPGQGGGEGNSTE